MELLIAVKGDTLQIGNWMQKKSENYLPKKIAHYYNELTSN